MALSQSAVSELLEAFRAATGILAGEWSAAPASGALPYPGTVSDGGAAAASSEGRPATRARSVRWRLRHR